MTRTRVHAGACGFVSIIEVEASDGVFRLRIESDCEMVEALAEQIGELSSTEALRRDSEVYRKALRCLRHISCPVPLGILKCLEVEAGLNVPRPVRIEFE